MDLYDLTVVKKTQEYKPIRIRMKENTEPNPQPAIKQASSAQVWEVEKCSLQACVCESEKVFVRQSEMTSVGVC